ncbi:hypothetical protein L4C33_14290 [Vibrio makurazakiensis]|uniref:putative adhesin n=1 Tax=Vibrio makurazakiensis TaxID=2910250 RepID=UPI003D115A91
MQDVYLIGHGFMDAQDTIKLSVPLQTYVKDGQMLDGRKTAAVVDGGPKAYKITSTDEEWKVTPAGISVKEHYLCGDMASYSDVNKTKKWQTKGMGSRQELVDGILFTLPGGDYLFFTRNNQAVRLSNIINGIRGKLGTNFQIHWTACRSIIQGNGNDQKLQAINGGDLVNAQSLR